MVDEIHGLPRKQQAAMTKQETGMGPLLPAPKSRWLRQSRETHTQGLILGFHLCFSSLSPQVALCEGFHLLYFPGHARWTWPSYPLCLPWAPSSGCPVLPRDRRHWPTLGYHWTWGPAKQVCSGDGETVAVWVGNMLRRTTEEWEKLVLLQT